MSLRAAFRSEINANSSSALSRWSSPAPAGAPWLSHCRFQTSKLLRWAHDETTHTRVHTSICCCENWGTSHMCCGVTAPYWGQRALIKQRSLKKEATVRLSPYLKWASGAFFSSSPQRLTAGNGSKQQPFHSVSALMNNEWAAVFQVWGGVWKVTSFNTTEILLWMFSLCPFFFNWTYSMNRKDAPLYSGT